MRLVPRGEHLFSAALIGIGLFSLDPRNGFSFGSLREPATGFFPVVVAVALILFAALALTSKGPAPDRAQEESGGVKRVLILAATIAAYAWFLPSVGFVLSTIVLLGVLLRLGGVGWLATIVCAAGGAAGCYFLFTQLGMPLPSGLLGI
jgi:cell division protein FtsW (lipid II flippase)